MARESKKTRDEKRFGKPERLADLMWDRGDMGTVVEATNVFKYYRQMAEVRDRVSFYDDLPCVALPWPSCFIEIQHDVWCRPAGWYFRRLDPETAWKHLGGYSEWHPFFPGGALRKGLHLVAGKFYWGSNGKAKGGFDYCFFAHDDSGKLLPGGIGFYVDRNVKHETDKKALKDVLFPCLLALSFMHCKNVTVNPVEPDVEINRERRKARLKPFVRYSTINIEPMKKVLRTEGQIETNGLRRALHICRGHFATYSEDRPLFGKVSGTFWKESHVRGSGKEGNVISDYRVKAPSLNPA